MPQIEILLSAVYYIKGLENTKETGGTLEDARFPVEYLVRKHREQSVASHRRNAAITKKVFEEIFV